jgi:hypothetical protein
MSDEPTKPPDPPTGMADQPDPSKQPVIRGLRDKVVGAFLGLTIMAAFMLIVGLVVVAVLSVPNLVTNATALVENVMSRLGSPAPTGAALPKVSSGPQEPAASTSEPETQPLTLSYVILKQLERDGQLNEAGRKLLASAESERTRQMLSIRVGEAARAGRFGDALRLQELLATETEREETATEGQPGEQTAAVLVNVVWYALLARAFDKGLAASERAVALLPDHPSAAVNRAHALLFSDRTREARAAYLKGKGREWDGKKWEDVITADFAELRKAGVVHPMTIRIETELRK